MIVVVVDSVYAYSLRPKGMLLVLARFRHGHRHGGGGEVEVDGDGERGGGVARAGRARETHRPMPH